MGYVSCGKNVPARLRPFHRVEDENAKLRRSLRSAQDAQAKASAKVRELEIARDQLVEELANVKRSVAGIGAMGLEEEEEADERVRSECLLERVRDLVGWRHPLAFCFTKALTCFSFRKEN